MLNDGTWFPLTMKLSYENTGPDEREDGAGPVQWAPIFYLFRADTLTDPLPGASWKTTLR